MDLSKFTLAVFDIFAYLLPGVVLLVLASFFEATFLSSQILTLTDLGKLPVPHLILAYFLGHLAHGFGTLMTERIKVLSPPRGGKLPDGVFNQIRERLIQTFNLDKAQLPNQKLDALSAYKFADSFVVAKDKAAERESLLLREAFALSSMGAFTAWALFGVAALLLQGAVSYQIDSGKTVTSIALSVGAGRFLTMSSFLMALVFWRRYIRFALMRRSGIYTLFMALTAKSP